MELKSFGMKILSISQYGFKLFYWLNINFNIKNKKWDALVSLLGYVFLIKIMVSKLRERDCQTYI